MMNSGRRGSASGRRSAGLRKTFACLCMFSLVSVIVYWVSASQHQRRDVAVRELLWARGGRIYQRYIDAAALDASGGGADGQAGDGGDGGDDGERSTDSPEFEYLLNEPDKCRPRAPFLVVLVVSAPTEFVARQVIRETWAKESPALPFKRLFLLGSVVASTLNTSKVQERIEDESRRHGDLIQQDFQDAYNNLTLKTMMGFHWASVHCPHASYIMKTDSDTFVNLEVLVEAVLKRQAAPPPPDYFTGYVMRGYLPHRDPKSKWYMPEHLYPEKDYPPFCSGTGYVLSLPLASRIYRVSLTVQRHRLEDVYVGMCLKILGVEPALPPDNLHFNLWRVPYSPCTYRRIVTAHSFSPSEVRHIWRDLQEHREEPCG